MNIAELIDRAVEKKGTRSEVARGLHQHPNRLTDWKAGKRKPDAHELAYLASCADLPVLETVAEIQAQLDNRYAQIWKKALTKLRAAGVAATVIAALGGLMAVMAPTESQATVQTSASQTSASNEVQKRPSPPRLFKRFKKVIERFINLLAVPMYC